MNSHSDQPSVLIVDDERFYLQILTETLQSDYRLVIAKDGEQALSRAAETPPPDLILLDWLMPGIDGLEVCRRLKTDPETADIPVIFLTVKSEIDDELEGFDVGAADYIRKPISPPVVRARVRNHLALRRAQQQLEDHNRDLERRIAQRTQELHRSREAAVYSMASLTEARDHETGYHIRRTQHYIRRLAEHLRDHPRFRDQLDDERIDLMFKTAPLHDIGKVGVPDRILLKPGSFTDEEWEEMKRHVEYGVVALDRAARAMGETEFIRVARNIVSGHHERWDGNGYPAGLAADEIPLEGRLMALADVYDALICERVYKPAMPHAKAVEIIARDRGTHFDPAVVDAFLNLGDEFDSIAREFSDLSADEDRAAHGTNGALKRPPQGPTAQGQTDS